MTTINFHDKEIPEKNIPCKCLSIIMLNSALSAYEKYHPQILLDECKYEQQKNKYYIDKEFKSDSDFNDEKEPVALVMMMNELNKIFQ